MGGFLLCVKSGESQRHVRGEANLGGVVGAVLTFPWQPINPVTSDVRHTVFNFQRVRVSDAQGNDAVIYGWRQMIVTRAASVCFRSTFCSWVALVQTTISCQCIGWNSISTHTRAQTSFGRIAHLCCVSKLSGVWDLRLQRYISTVIVCDYQLPLRRIGCVVWRFWDL